MKTRYLLIFITLLWVQTSLNGQSEDTRWGQNVRYRFSLDALANQDAVNQGSTIQAWYMLKKKVGIGPAISYRHYNSSLRETIFNVGIDAIFLTGPNEAKLKTFGAFQTGLGFPVLINSASDTKSILSSRLYVQPQIGLLISTGRLSDISLSFGFIHQGLDYVSEGNTAGLNLNYNRYVVSIGVMF